VVLYPDLSSNACRHVRTEGMTAWVYNSIRDLLENGFIIFDEHFIDTITKEYETGDQEVALYLLFERLSHERMHTSIDWTFDFMWKKEEGFVIYHNDLPNQEALLTGEHDLSMRIREFFWQHKDRSPEHPEGFRSGRYFRDYKKMVNMNIKNQ